VSNSYLCYKNGQVFCQSDHRRKVFRIELPFTTAVQINDDCIGNEFVSLTRRHLLTSEREETPERRRVIDEAFRLLNKHYPPEHLTPFSIDRVIQAKAPSLRRKYKNAYTELCNRGLDARDYRISMFIKLERMSYPGNDVSSLTLKPPRAIQARSAKFNLCAQKYFIPYARLWKHRVSPEQPNTPFMKGFNQKQIAEILRDDWESFNDPVAILFDHERWDSGLTRYWLIKEHKYYDAHFNAAELRQLLAKQLKNKGRTRHGLRYVVIATRMSGDPDTGDGNSTCNLALILHLIRMILARKRVMGDDSVVIMERWDYENILKARLGDLGVLYGWKTSVKVVYQFEDIEFCQCQPVLTSNGWLMVRNPLRTFTRATTCINQSVILNPALFKRWLKGVGLSEKAVNPGVPVHSAFAGWCIRASSHDAIYDPGYKDWLRKIPGVVSHVISEESRLSYELAFGISVPYQRQLENYFNTLEHNFVYQNVPDPIPACSLIQ
jgi:hypothetical protein